MIGETREAIEAYCVAVGLVVYEWNDLHEKLARLFASSAREIGGNPHRVVRDSERHEAARKAQMRHDRNDIWPVEKVAAGARRSKVAA